MSVRSDLARNPWVLRLMACVALAGLNFLAAVLVHASWVVATPPTVAVDGLSLWALVMAVRTELAHVGAESAAQVRASAEARELRTPRVPNAGPDQCPVCGGLGLADLAADDAFMERGPDRAKVVAWGSRRAHWDCAELMPCKPPAVFNADGNTRELRPTPLGFGAICTCRFCGEQKTEPNMEAAKVRLIEHAKECPKRPKPTAPEPMVTGKLRASVAPQPFRWRGMDVEAREAALAPCRPTATEAAWREALERPIRDERRS